VNKKFSCIFCDQQVNEVTVPEHIIPESMGSPLTIGNVCSKCNHFLGSMVDSKLTDLWFIQARRNLNGIKNKDGKVPDLNFGITHLKENPNHKVLFKRAGDGKVILKTVYNEIRNENNIKIIIDKDEDKEKLLRKKRERLEKEGLNISSTSYSETKIDGPLLEANLGLHLLAFQPALVKIVFEYAYYRFGEFFLKSSNSSLMKNFILELDSEKRREISLNGIYFPSVPEDKPLDKIMSVEDAHTLFTMDNFAGLYLFGKPWCFLELFTIEEMRSLPREKLDGFVTLIDPKKKEIREYTLPNFLQMKSH
jgi:HNH endonuclease